MSTDRMIIVGGGLAAATAAETLRDEGFDGDVVLYTAEEHLPYLRPPLSKGYLLGSESRDQVFVHDAAWYAEHDIEIVGRSRVVSIDPGGATITMLDDTVVEWDSLLLATGATPRRLDLPGVSAHGIHTLRRIEDSEALRHELRDGGHDVVIIGNGWIGLELAAAARTYGNTVTVIGRTPVPLTAALGDEMGRVFRDMHVEHGVRFVSEVEVTGFTTDGDRVSGVTVDGETLPAQVVIIGIGAEPAMQAAVSGGLTVGNGVHVDEHMRTSAPGIWAAGDVANPLHPVLGERMRNEHWANAIGGAKIAARSMLGIDAVFDEIPYFYTDQYDLGMEYSGYPSLAADARMVLRGDRDAREFIAFWLNGDRVVAGMNVNIWDVNDQVQQLIRSGRDVDESRLRDAAVALTDV